MLNTEGVANNFSGLDPLPTFGQDGELLATPFLFGEV